ncbi:MAG: tetratricopeptide repeat protein [Candidatus Dependentiae bacterium]
MLLIFFYIFLFFAPNIIIAGNTEKFPSYAAVTSGKQKAPKNGFSNTKIAQQQVESTHLNNQDPYIAILLQLEKGHNAIQALPTTNSKKDKKTIKKTLNSLQSLAEMNEAPPIWGWHPAWTSQAEAWKFIGKLEEINGNNKSAIQSNLNALFVAHNNTLHTPDDGHDHYPVDDEVVTSLTRLMNTEDNLKYIPDLLQQAGLETEIEQQQYLIPLYKYADQIGSKDGTYLLAKHKQKCGTVKNLKKAEQLFSGLVQTKNKNAFIDLLVTQHALVSKLQELDKQSEAEQKQNTFFKTAEQNIKTRQQFEMVIAEFEQTGNQQAIYELAEHMFKKTDTKRKDNFRFKAAFEAAKREPNRTKSDIYLSLAVHHIAEAQTYAFELHKKTQDPQRSMSLLKMAADSGHPEASYLYGCSLKEKYVNSKVKDRNLIVQAQKYLKHAAEHKNADLETKLEYATTAHNHEDAIKRLRALGKEPRAYFHLGETYKQYAKHPTTKPRMQKRYQQHALEYYKKASDAGCFESTIRLASLHTEMAIVQKNNKEKEKHLTEAKDLIEKTLRSDITQRQRSNILCSRGNMYLYQDNIHDAITSLLKAYKTDQSNYAACETLYLVIDKLKERKSYELMIYTCEKILETNNQSHQAHLALGVAYLSKKNPQKAIEHFDQSEKLGSHQAAYNLGLLFARDKTVEKDLDKAIKHLQRTLEISPNFEKALNLLGNIHQERNERKTARSYFMRSAMQGSGEGNFAMGQCYQKGLGGALNLTRALEYYTTAHDNFALNKRKIDQEIARINMKLCFYLNANHLSRYSSTEIPKQFKKIEEELFGMLPKASPELHNEIHLALAIQNGFMASYVQDKNKAKEHRNKAFTTLKKVLVATNGDRKKINLDSVRALYHLSNILIKPIMNCSNNSLTTEQKDDLKQAKNSLEKITDLKVIPSHFKDEGILDLALNDLATVYKRFFNDDKKSVETLEKGAERGGTICCISLAQQYENKDLQKTKKLLEEAVSYGGLGSDDAYKHLIVIKSYLREKIEVPVEEMFLKDYSKKTLPIIQAKTKRFEQSEGWNNLTSEQRNQLTRLTFGERRSIFASLDLSIE